MRKNNKKVKKPVRLKSQISFRVYGELASFIDKQAKLTDESRNEFAKRIFVSGIEKMFDVKVVGRTVVSIDGSS